MPEEILNIQYHVKRIVLKALNQSSDLEEAAKLLGIDKRTLFDYRKNFGIIYSKERNEFYFRSDNVKILK